MDSIKYYLPGIILILIAIIIVAVPEILIAFIASIIIIAGISALYIGHRIKKSEMKFRQTDDYFPNEDLFGHRIFRRPLFKNWHRWF